MGYITTSGGLDLYLEHGQWCAQLVRGIAHKAFLVVQQATQALHDAVGAIKQRPQFAWHRM